MNKVVMLWYSGPQHMVVLNFHTRHRLTTAQVEDLRHIDGIINHYIGDYCVTVVFGRAFDFVHIAAAALRVMARAMDVPLWDLQVGSLHEEDLACRALTKAKELELANQAAEPRQEARRLDAEVSKHLDHAEECLIELDRVIGELRKLEEQI